MGILIPRAGHPLRRAIISPKYHDRVSSLSSPQYRWTGIWRSRARAPMFHAAADVCSVCCGCGVCGCVTDRLRALEAISTYTSQPKQGLHVDCRVPPFFFWRPGHQGRDDKSIPAEWNLLGLISIIIILATQARLRLRDAGGEVLSKALSRRGAGWRHDPAIGGAASTQRRKLRWAASRVWRHPALIGFAGAVANLSRLASGVASLDHRQPPGSRPGWLWLAAGPTATAGLTLPAG